MSQCQCVHTPNDAPLGADGVRCPNEAAGKVEAGDNAWEMCGPCIKDLTGAEPSVPEPRPWSDLYHDGDPVEMPIREPHIR